MAAAQQSAGRPWICLDVGETLIDETRVWVTWARVLDITPLTFMAALGVAIAQGNFRDVFGRLGRDDWRREQPAFDAMYGAFRADDLYPDALPALAVLRERGYRLAVLANQPARRTAELRALGIEAEVMAMSEELGLLKPDPAFFERALELMGEPEPADVAYVGDRLDNDILPAAAAGMQAVWLRRGPWAALAPGEPDAAALVANSLTELVGRIADVLPLPAAGRR